MTLSWAKTDRIISVTWQTQQETLDDTLYLFSIQYATVPFYVTDQSIVWIRQIT
jgi:hypothetical protein